MQSLTSKPGHLKFILAPLVIILVIALDCSDDINALFEIKMDCKNEYVSFFILKQNRGIISFVRCLLL